MTAAADLTSVAWDALRDVPDPEVPVLSVVDLGIVRDVVVAADGRSVRVDITPTYSGCPALKAIEDDVAAALRTRFADVRVRTVLSPPWTTDWLSDEGRRKLAESGIAPPHRPELPAGRRLLPLSVVGSGPASGTSGRPPRCPHCGGERLTLVSEFGSTACKAMYRCESCAEPFDYFKAH